MNNNMKQMPNLFILGAAKAGTTTVYDLLKQHPQIFLSFDKEPMYFSRDDFFERGMNWYIKTYFQGSYNFPTRGEATPHYLYWAEKVSPRMHLRYGTSDIKFIVILRDPIQRAYSWYWNMMSDGRESLSFLDALQVENERIKENWNDLEYYGSMQYGYFRGGCYMAQIRAFLKNFPKDHFHFLLQEDLIRNQKTTIENIFQFLNINTEIDIKPTISNTAAMPRNRVFRNIVKKQSKLKESIKPFFPAPFRYRLKLLMLKVNMKQFRYPDMSNEARSYLKHRYASEVAELSKFLDRDLGYWINS